MVHPNPLIDPHFETVKDIAINTGEDTSGTQLYHQTKLHFAPPPINLSPDKKHYYLKLDAPHSTYGG